MARVLDEMTLTVYRRPGRWLDGPWVPYVDTLTVALDGDPTPKSTATLSDVTRFEVGLWAAFYDTAGLVLGIAKIVAIDGGTKVITFETDSLTWDADVGDQVQPVVQIQASRPQPLGGEQLALLPEGARSTARFMIYADDDQPELNVIEATEHELAADRLVYKSRSYLVTSIEDWGDMNLGHQAYILLAWGPDEKVD
jgi:hypothetical protein